MPRRGGRHKVLVVGAEEAMDAFKLEVAQDLGLGHLIDEEGSYKNLTTLQVGQIGGEMVRRINAAGQFAIMQRHKEGYERLIPDEVLPDKRAIRNVSNNGNTSPLVLIQDPSLNPPQGNSGQQWKPNDNDMTEHLH